MSTLPERWQVRAEFGALLKAELEGEGKLARAVYAYTVKDFGHLMPAVVLGSSGTERKPFTACGTRPSYLLDLFSFVRFAALTPITEDGGGELVIGLDGQPVWDEADSEETLDRLEAAVAEVVADNQRGASWKSIAHDGRSEVDIVDLGGITYRRERTPFRFETF